MNKKQETTEYIFLPKFNTLTICLIGVFSALCYASLYLKIPLPSPVGKPMVHLGNMIVMICAVLFNGFTGGISGAIGMGLYDSLNGYGASSIKTIILKFGIGIIIGLVFYLLNNKQPSIKKFLIAATFFFYALGLFILFYSIKYNGSITIEGLKKPVIINWSSYVFSFIIATFSLVMIFVTNRFPKSLQYVLIACICGFLFNLVGEFVGKVITQAIAGATFETCIVTSFFSLPATIINGTLSVVITVAIYLPLKKAIPSNNKKYQ